MSGLHVEAVCVIEEAVEGFGYDGHGPESAAADDVGTRRSFVPNLPLDERITDHANAVRVGKQHRPVKKPRLFNPGGASHLAVAVQRPPPCEGWIVRGSAARPYR